MMNQLAVCCDVAVAIALLMPMAAVAQMPTLPVRIWPDETRVWQVLQPTVQFDAAEKYELMQGGAATVRKAVDANVYSHHTQTLDFEGLQRFKLGNALFNKFWVSSPSSTLASDGLGPFFSARACQSCHIKDGRGQLPQRDEKTASLVLQLKRKVADQWRGDPVYGSQLQPSSVTGLVPEAFVQVRYNNSTVALHDEANVQLREPVYRLQRLGYGELADDTILSARLATAMPGLGLIDAIDTRHILGYEDPLDENGDGVSGRANWQTLPDGRVELGRFGHKASTATVAQQIAHAFRDDMGLSTDLLPTPNGDCTATQRCDELPNGVQPQLADSEVSEQIMQLVTFYSSHLAVPARRDVDDADVLAGKAIFYKSGCIACHVPKHVTSRRAPRRSLSTASS